MLKKIRHTSQKCARVTDMVYEGVSNEIGKIGFGKPNAFLLLKSSALYSSKAVPGGNG
jgi:hypothetical protein